MKSVAISLLVIALSLSAAVNANILEAQELKASALDNEFLRSEAGHDFVKHLPPVEPEKSCSKPKVICSMKPVVKMVLNKVCADKCKAACNVKWCKNPVQLKICLAGCDAQCMEKVVEYVKVCVPVNDSESSCSYSRRECGRQLPIKWEESCSYSRKKCGHQLPIKWEKSCSYPRRKCGRQLPIKWEDSCSYPRRKCGCRRPIKCEESCSESNSCAPILSESSSSSMGNGNGTASASGSASSNGEVTVTTTASGMSIDAAQSAIVIGSKGGASLPVKWN
jgi:hypothetical protein